jgi:hypothetical protein
MVTSTNEKSKHQTVPPCHCPQCLRATAQADQERAKIAEILALNEVELLGGEVAK